MRKRNKLKFSLDELNKDAASGRNHTGPAASRGKAASGGRSTKQYPDDDIRGH